MSIAPTRHRTVAAALAVLLNAAALVVPSTPAHAVITSTALTGLESRDQAGAPGGGVVGPTVFVDDSGRFVVFQTSASLAPEDTGGSPDIYLRDRLSGATTLVGLDDADGPIMFGTNLCGISDDANTIVFTSTSVDLPGYNGKRQLYARNRHLGTTQIVSTNAGGSPAAGTGVAPDVPCAVSDDGRYVAFAASSDNLVANDSNGVSDVFRKDRMTGAVTRVSIAANGAQANGPSTHPAMTSSGDRVVFQSTANNLVANDLNGVSDVFQRTPAAPNTSRVSVAGANTELNGPSGSPSISDLGGIVAFTSTATNATADVDPYPNYDVFVRNANSNTTELVSQTSNGTIANLGSFLPSVSSSGRYIGFASWANNLYILDNNAAPDAFVRDRQLGHTDLASRVTAGFLVGDAASGAPMVSDDGTVAAFASDAGNLVRNDPPGAQLTARDAFTRDTTVPFAPFDGFESLIEQQTKDFVDAALTPAGMAELKARIVNGEQTPAQLVDELAHGPVWAGKRAPLTRLYWAFFLRIPDLDGLVHWVGKLQAGKSLAWVAAQFATSAEFQNTYGSLSNQAFVKLVYKNVLDRNADANGLAFWTKKLDDKAKTRGDVMAGFSESPEAKRLLAPQVDSVLIALGMLRVMPDADLFADSVDYLRSGGPPEGVVDAIFGLSAYTSRFL
ncbi:MAG: domain protein beta Propeller [Acidimicrobiales bacterium]|nr:domain protein beta Propeller [Acidimicrobiales bacterium]